MAILKLGQIETFPGFLDQRDASKGVNYWPKTSGSLEVCTVLVASCAAWKKMHNSGFEKGERAVIDKAYLKAFWELKYDFGFFYPDLLLLPIYIFQ